MKKSLLLFSFSLIIVASLFAQDKEKKPVSYRQSFTIKFAPAGLAVGKVTFGGEYNFKRKQSITFMVGLPFDKNRNIDFDNKTSVITSSAKSAMLGYRYYLGKKSRSGFYVEPYAKYVNLKAHGFLDANLNGDPARFDTHATYEGYGAGIQLGFQFFIAKTLAIDLFLIGPEANSAKLNTSSTDVYDNIPWTLANADDAAKEIHDKLKDIPYIGDKIDVTVNTNTKTVFTKYAGFAPGFRAGFSVGIRF